MEKVLHTGEIRQESLVVQRSPQDCANTRAEMFVSKSAYILIGLTGD